MKPNRKWVPVAAAGVGALAIAALAVWLAWPGYPAACMDGGNYQRILEHPWPQTRKSLSDDAIAGYRAKAKAMISRVLATDIPGSLICPPAAKHPINAMDDHFDGCLFSDFRWEGDVLSCRPSYWYVKRVSSRHSVGYGHVDSVVKVDFRKSPKAVVYADRFVEIKVSEEWYPYNGVLRIPTPNAKAARRLLDAFEVLGAVPVQQGWHLRWGAAAQATPVPLPQDPRPSKYGRMALEQVYMTLRKGALSRRGRTISAETLRFHDDYTLVLGGRKKRRGVTITRYLPEPNIGSVEISGRGTDDDPLVMTGKVEDEPRTRPSIRKVVMAAREVYIRVVGNYMQMYVTELEMRTKNRIMRAQSQTFLIPLLKVGRNQLRPEGGR